MIAWFAKNSIAANFMMIGLLLLGAWSAFEKVQTEVEPSFDLGQVRVRVQVPGATPETIERLVLIPIERSLERIQGKQQIEAQAGRGSAEVTIRAEEGVDLNQFRDEIAASIDSIRSFPQEAERPRYYIPNTGNWFEVISVVVSGDLERKELLEATRQVRDDLMAIEGISKVEIQNDSEQEISIEVDPGKLRDYGLSMQSLSQAITRSSVDVSAGALRSESGSLLLRTSGQAMTADEFGDIMVTRRNGSDVLLRDLALVEERFRDDLKVVRFNGRPAFSVEVVRQGNENALEIAAKVREYVKTAALPEGINVTAWDDEAVPLEGRLRLLTSSLLQGILLVLVLLGLFLRPSLAFWIVLGIPVAFAGALIFMPVLGVSANVMSLFGFIIVLGIVVDDAIVTGEHIFSKMKAGVPNDIAVIEGTKEIARPVTFGVLTTMVAFMPLAFFDGWWGNYARQIPLVVIPVLFFSLIESKLILPAHLRHLQVNRTKLGPLAKFQKGISDGLVWCVDHLYRPSLRLAVNFRYGTLALFLLIAAGAIGYGMSGKMGWNSIPSVDRYIIYARVQMEGGTSFDRTDEVIEEVRAAVEPLRGKFIDPGTGESLIRNVMTSTGGWPSWGGFRDNQGFVLVELTPPSQRSEPGPKNAEITAAWYESVGKIEGIRDFSIQAEDNNNQFGGDRQSLSIEVRGANDELRPQAAAEIASLLRGHPGIKSASSSRERAQEEISFTLKPTALELGLTQSDLARQIREAFFGNEVQRFQRGVDELRVMMRLPQSERENLHTLETLRISLPDGSNTSLSNVAELEQAPVPRRIERLDGSRYLVVTANPEETGVGVDQVATELEPAIQAITAKYPGVSWRFTGVVKENRATARSTTLSSIILIFVLYALLAIPFKSLLQPFFVLIAIPFGVVGAMIGHLILDITPSFLSFFGLLALAGVVVNDSLVMVDFTNQRRREGASPYDAVINSGAARFRPILLTSMTTFAGLMPLMFETAIHAQFLIPMAVSLGFGILFATVITLYLIPCCYLTLEDILSLCRKAWNWYRHPHRRES